MFRAALDSRAAPLPPAQNRNTNPPILKQISPDHQRLFLQLYEANVLDERGNLCKEHEEYQLPPLNFEECAQIDELINREFVLTINQDELKLSLKELFAVMKDAALSPIHFEFANSYVTHLLISQTEYAKRVLQLFGKEELYEGNALSCSSTYQITINAYSAANFPDVIARALAQIYTQKRYKVIDASKIFKEFFADQKHFQLSFDIFAPKGMGFQVLGFKPGTHSSSLLDDLGLPIDSFISGAQTTTTPTSKRGNALESYLHGLLGISKSDNAHSNTDSRITLDYIAWLTSGHSSRQFIQKKPSLDRTFFGGRAFSPLCNALTTIGYTPEAGCAYIFNLAIRATLYLQEDAETLYQFEDALKTVMYSLYYTTSNEAPYIKSTLVEDPVLKSMMHLVDEGVSFHTVAAFLQIVFSLSYAQNGETQSTGFNLVTEERQNPTLMRYFDNATIQQALNISDAFDEFSKAQNQNRNWDRIGPLFTQLFFQVYIPSFVNVNTNPYFQKESLNVNFYPNANSIDRLINNPHSSPICTYIGILGLMFLNKSPPSIEKQQAVVMASIDQLVCLQESSSYVPESFLCLIDFFPPVHEPDERVAQFLQWQTTYHFKIKEDPKTALLCWKKSLCYDRSMFALSCVRNYGVKYPQHALEMLQHLVNHERLGDPSVVTKEIFTCARLLRDCSEAKFQHQKLTVLLAKTLENLVSSQKDFEEAVAESALLDIELLNWLSEQTTCPELKNLAMKLAETQLSIETKITSKGKEPENALDKEIKADSLFNKPESTIKGKALVRANRKPVKEPSSEFQSSLALQTQPLKAVDVVKNINSFAPLRFAFSQRVPLVPKVPITILKRPSPPPLESYPNLGASPGQISRYFPPKEGISFLEALKPTTPRIPRFNYIPNTLEVENNKKSYKQRLLSKTVVRAAKTFNIQSNTHFSSLNKRSPVTKEVTTETPSANSSKTYLQALKPVRTIQASNKQELLNIESHTTFSSLDRPSQATPKTAKKTPAKSSARTHLKTKRLKTQWVPKAVQIATQITQPLTPKIRQITPLEIQAPEVSAHKPEKPLEMPELVPCPEVMYAQQFSEMPPLEPTPEKLNQKEEVRSEKPPAKSKKNTQKKPHTREEKLKQLVERFLISSFNQKEFDRFLKLLNKTSFCAVIQSDQKKLISIKLLDLLNQQSPAIDLRDEDIKNLRSFFKKNLQDLSLKKKFVSVCSVRKFKQNLIRPKFLLQILSQWLEQEPGNSSQIAAIYSTAFEQNLQTNPKFTHKLLKYAVSKASHSPQLDLLGTVLINVAKNCSDKASKETYLALIEKFKEKLLCAPLSNFWVHHLSFATQYLHASNWDFFGRLLEGGILANGKTPEITKLLALQLQYMSSEEHQRAYHLMANESSFCTLKSIYVNQPKKYQFAGLCQLLSIAIELLNHKKTFTHEDIAKQLLFLEHVVYLQNTLNTLVNKSTKIQLQQIAKQTLNKLKQLNFNKTNLRDLKDLTLLLKWNTRVFRNCQDVCEELPVKETQHMYKIFHKLLAAISREASAHMETGQQQVIDASWSACCSLVITFCRYTDPLMDSVNEENLEQVVIFDSQVQEKDPVEVVSLIYSLIKTNNATYNPDIIDLLRNNPISDLPASPDFYYSIYLFLSRHLEQTPESVELIDRCNCLQAWSSFVHAAYVRKRSNYFDAQAMDFNSIMGFLESAGSSIHRKELSPYYADIVFTLFSELKNAKHISQNDKYDYCFRLIEVFSSFFPDVKDAKYIQALNEMLLLLHTAPVGQRSLKEEGVTIVAITMLVKKGHDIKQLLEVYTKRLERLKTKLLKSNAKNNLELTTLEIELLINKIEVCVKDETPSKLFIRLKNLILHYIREPLHIDLFYRESSITSAMTLLVKNTSDQRICDFFLEIATAYQPRILAYETQAQARLAAYLQNFFVQKLQDFTKENPSKREGQRLLQKAISEERRLEEAAKKST